MAGHFNLSLFVLKVLTMKEWPYAFNILNFYIQIEVLSTDLPSFEFFHNSMLLYGRTMNLIGFWDL